jgi:hypothetical protein
MPSKKGRGATKNGYIMQVSTTFCRNGKCCQKAKTKDKPRKNKMCDSGKEKHLKKTFENKNYKFK